MENDPHNRVVEPDFDLYRDSYSHDVQEAISFIHQDHGFFTELKARRLLELAQRRIGDPADLQALDVGCGVGLTDSYLTGRFRSLHGVDVSPGVVEAAADRNRGVAYESYDGKALPFESGTFDLVFTICVLHHVPPEGWSDFVVELRRVTRPGGLVAVFEHNPINPLTRLVVSRCEFDEDAVLLRPRRVAELMEEAALVPDETDYLEFFPWRPEPLRKLERLLRRVPFGAQYLVAGRHPG